MAIYRPASRRPLLIVGGVALAAGVALGFVAGQATAPGVAGVIDGRPPGSSHDSSDWHMHVTSRGASVSQEFLAGAVWGLSVWLCEYGSARFGVCADERCGNVYLDTSSNCCRRFCSERCATRSHVAAHRARKRAAEEKSLSPVS
mgnify:CR=1 FL=1